MPEPERRSLAKTDLSKVKGTILEFDLLLGKAAELKGWQGITTESNNEYLNI